VGWAWAVDLCSLHLTIDAIGGWLGLGSGEGVGSLPYGWGLGWWGSGKGRDCLAIYGEGWDKGREVVGVYCMCRERGMHEILEKIMHFNNFNNINLF